MDREIETFQGKQTETVHNQQGITIKVPKRMLSTEEGES